MQSGASCHAIDPESLYRHGEGSVNPIMTATETVANKIAKLEKQPNSKFKLNTDELELLLKSRGVENYKNKVLKFRKQFLEKNKNLIK